MLGAQYAVYEGDLLGPVKYGIGQVMWDYAREGSRDGRKRLVWDSWARLVVAVFCDGEQVR